MSAYRNVAGRSIAVARRGPYVVSTFFPDPKIVVDSGPFTCKPTDASTPMSRTVRWRGVKVGSDGRAAAGATAQWVAHWLAE